MNGVARSRVLAAQNKYVRASSGEQEDTPRTSARCPPHPERRRGEETARLTRAGKLEAGSRGAGRGCVGACRANLCHCFIQLTSNLCLLKVLLGSELVSVLLFYPQVIIG